MMGIFPLSLLGFGFLLGIRHAFDVDHIAAVSTIIHNHKSIKKSTLVGLFWGFGHTISLLIAGLLILLFKISVPEKIALSLEFIVGIVLVLLGINVLFTMNKNKVHFHRHKHGNKEHIHFHSHKLAKNHSHEHMHLSKSLITGIVHGLAGSAAITLLVLTAINSLLLSLIYILIFGIGSIIGMMLISSIISLPFILIPNKLKNSHKILSMGTSLVAISIGLTVIYNVSLAFY